MKLTEECWQQPTDSEKDQKEGEMSKAELDELHQMSQPVDGKCVHVI